MATQRPRLDQLVVERGLVETREKARSLILQGKVRVEGEPVTKPGTRVPPDAGLEVDAKDQPVSRGAHKLERGLERFPLELAEKPVLDAGASTGGFTELALKRGASRVYAVDVGRGQLAWKLQQDARVVVLDRTNVRTVEAAAFDPRPEVLIGDLSFISLLKVLPNLAQVLVPGAPGIMLVKPQFEAGRARLEKGAVIRKASTHREVLGEVVEGVRRLGWAPLGVCPSPIKGAKGNTEFLLYLRAPGGAEEAAGVGEAEVDAAVAEAHAGGE